MNKEIIQNIVNKLDNETAEYAVRDITLLACSIFTDTHLVSFRKIFNFNEFSLNFWFTRNDGQVVFYRSGKEYNLLGEKIGMRCLNEIEFAQEIANTLIKMSDEINTFINKTKNKNDLIAQWQYFNDLYRDFFAYHQSVYWASVYLSKVNEKNNNIEEILNTLDNAYKYNETVVPSVEKYFLEMGISNRTNDEISNSFTTETIPKNRSILMLDAKKQVLSFEEASKISGAIEMAYKKYIDSLKTVSGLSVAKGKVSGKVIIVCDLSRLVECKMGDILVTTQTRPQYNTFIKNVAAIVTDEGGILCHASMLAREFGIPCIVGTKNATKVLKSGDLVEVDANAGIVKIIKKTTN